ncbi:MAG: hypothetical protein D6681_22385, partial [Calditrichaeota bacterium]
MRLSLFPGRGIFAAAFFQPHLLPENASCRFGHSFPVFSKLRNVIFLVLLALSPMLSGQETFTGVWHEGRIAHKIWVDSEWPVFLKKWKELASQGYRLVDIETLDKNGTRKYYGLWHAGTDRYKLWIDMDWEALKRYWNEYKDDGLRLVDLEITVDGGERKFIGVWREGDFHQKLLVDA